MEYNQPDYFITAKLPEKVRSILLASYGKYNNDSASGYAISDNTANVYLSNLLGLQTDSPRYEINQSFVVWFNWRLLCWMVK